MATFKKIPGYSIYEISENGEIRKIVSKEVISQRVHPVYGYKMCDLLDDNLKVHTVYPHKEVARTYMPVNKGMRMYVIHLNGNPKDNRLKNLKWATPAEAQLHQVKMGLRKRIGNPELYKFSKFWLAKQNKKKGNDKAVIAKETVKGKGKASAKAAVSQKSKVAAKKAVNKKAAKAKTVAKPKVTAKTKTVASKKTTAKKTVKPSNIKIKKGKTSSKVTSVKAQAIKKSPAKIAAKKPVELKKAVAKKSAKPAKTAVKKVENKKNALPKNKAKATKVSKKTVSKKSKKMGEDITTKRVPSKLLKSNNEAKVERKEKRQRIKYKKVVSSAGRKS